jgi:perosamine synthetase
MKQESKNKNLINVPAAKIDFDPSQRQWITERISEALESGQLTMGKYGEEFERDFSKLCGSKHAICVSSGTAALEIIFRSLNVADKDVLVPTNTNFATVAALIRAGGNPVLMDTDASTFGTHPEEARRRLTSATVGLAVVHIGGIISPQMEALVNFANDNGLWLIEDAAHAHGSSYAGTPAGTFGRAGAFSFFPTKVMTSAEGGMIVTNDDDIAGEARIYRDQGKASYSQNVHVRMGLNWRLSEPHAIIGLSHLTQLGNMVSCRQAIARIYDQELSGLDSLSLVKIPQQAVCNYYKYIVLLKDRMDRNAYKQRLRDEFGVALTGEVYEVPIHKQPVFEYLCRYPLPIADDVCARHLCLPVFASMNEDQAMLVINALKSTL